MRRREFIGTFLAALAGTAAAAQEPSRVRKVGILMPYPASDAEIQDRVEALRQELRALGWRTGENVALDERWVADDMARVRAAAAELAAAKPDVIVATGARVIPVLKQQTSSVPIIFVATTDPLGRGLVPSLARRVGT